MDVSKWILAIIGSIAKPLDISFVFLFLSLFFLLLVGQLADACSDKGAMLPATKIVFL